MKLRVSPVFAKVGADDVAGSDELLALRLILNCEWSEVDDEENRLFRLLLSTDMDRRDITLQSTS